MVFGRKKASEAMPLKAPAAETISIASLAAKSYGSCGPPAIATRNLSADVDPTLFTSHGKGLVDIVLAYQPLDMTDAQTLYRETFESKLRNQGLYIEHEDLAQSQDGKTCFTKIHAPWETLSRMAEINRMKMPLQKSDLEDPEEMRKSDVTYRCTKCCCCGKHPCELESEFAVPTQPAMFTLEFQRTRFRQYMVQDPNTFFSQCQRINTVWDIVERTLVNASEVSAQNGALLAGHRDGDSVGVDFMIKAGVYAAAYPLHDGDIYVDEQNKKRKPRGVWPLRPWLYETWARAGRWYKFQPLDQIRAYYGEKIALYFAWLGFYTSWLVLLTVAGLLCFVYGLVYFTTDVPMHDMCESDFSASIICRRCASDVCPFTHLNESCTYGMLTPVFNNGSTIIFAFFTALWCMCFLEFWKREQASLACRWDTYDVEYEYEPPRPEYIAASQTKRRNPVTQEWEPHIPTRSRLQNIAASVVSVTFLVCIVLAVIAGVITYKVIMIVIYHSMNSDIIEALGSDTFTSLTASIINSIAIIILEQVYRKVAWKLTENEYPRSDNDFETSFMYKMYIFQFINYYATLFYLAYVQGNVAGNPSNDTIITDRCPPSGCTFSVTMQLATLLSIKMTVGQVTELGVPMLHNYMARRGNVEATEENVYARHEKDFDLTALPEMSLFDEYFEMIMQYGFVTMFVAAFPLAPLMALLNNIVEIRLDAYKFTAESRRALPIRAANIGSWYDILEFVSRIAVITNACVIAFTTDLIDRMVYAWGGYSADGSLDGYMQWSLSVFNTNDWHSDTPLAVDPDFGNVTECLFTGYYNPWNASNPYAHSRVWYTVMLAKLAFVLIFEHVVFFTQSVIQYMVPDVPENVSLHVQRNRYLAKFTAYKSELARQESVRRAKDTAAARRAHDETDQAPAPPPAAPPRKQRGGSAASPPADRPLPPPSVERSPQSSAPGTAKERSTEQSETDALLPKKQKKLFGKNKKIQ